MSYLVRLSVAFSVTIAVAAAAIIYFRAGGVLFELAQTDGPFDPVIGMLNALVPVALVILLSGTWGWVLYGGVRNKQRRGVIR